MQAKTQIGHGRLVALGGVQDCLHTESIVSLPLGHCEQRRTA
jgi:hypothetical protein